MPLGAIDSRSIDLDSISPVPTYTIFCVEVIENGDPPSGDSETFDQQRRLDPADCRSHTSVDMYESARLRIGR